MKKNATEAVPQAKQTSSAPVAPPDLQPPSLPQRTPEEQIHYEDFYLATLRKFEILKTHYRFKGATPAHTMVKAERIRAAPNLYDAATLAQKAEDSMFLACLAAWAKGEISGPERVEDAFTLEQRAKKAESLAAALRKKGDEDGFKDQMMRAIELREKVKELRKQTP